MVFCPGAPSYLRHPSLPRPPTLLPALVPPDGSGTGVADGVVPARHWTTPSAGTAAAVGDGVGGGTLAGTEDIMEECNEALVMVLVTFSKCATINCFRWYIQLIQINI